MGAPPHSPSSHGHPSSSPLATPPLPQPPSPTPPQSVWPHPFAIPPATTKAPANTSPAPPTASATTPHRARRTSPPRTAPALTARRQAATPTAAAAPVATPTAAGAAPPARRSATVTLPAASADRAHAAAVRSTARTSRSSHRTGGEQEGGGAAAHVALALHPLTIGSPTAASAVSFPAPASMVVASWTAAASMVAEAAIVAASTADVAGTTRLLWSGKGSGGDRGGGSRGLPRVDPRGRAATTAGGTATVAAAAAAAAVAAKGGTIGGRGDPAPYSVTSGARPLEAAVRMAPSTATMVKMERAGEGEGRRDDWAPDGLRPRADCRWRKERPRQAEGAAGSTVQGGARSASTRDGRRSHGPDGGGGGCSFVLARRAAAPEPARRRGTRKGCAGPARTVLSMGWAPPSCCQTNRGGGARAAGSSRRRWRPAGVERWSTGRGWQATCPRQARLSGGVPRTRSKGGLPATCVMHHPRVTNGGATPSIAWVIHTSCPQCMMCNVYIRGGSRPVAAWEGGTCRSGVAATGSDAAKWACGRERPSGRAHPHADLWTWGTCAPPPPRPCCLWRVAPAYIPMGGGGPALVGGSRPRHCQHRGARPRTACVVGWLRPAAWARWMTVLVPRGGARPRSDRP